MMCVKEIGQIHLKLESRSRSSTSCLRSFKYAENGNKRKTEFTYLRLFVQHLKPKQIPENGQTEVYKINPLS